MCGHLTTATVRMVDLRRPEHSSARNAEALFGSFVAEWVLGEEYEVDCTFECDVRTDARTDCLISTSGITRHLSGTGERTVQTRRRRSASPAPTAPE